MDFSIRERVDEQEKRMIELIRENSQLKRDGLAMEAILADNATLRKEIAERRSKPVSAKDWEMKVAETQSKYKGKAIAEGKLKKKVERLEATIKRLEAELEEARNTPPQEILVQPDQKPKVCIVRADFPVFRDLDEAYERIESLLKENEAYREWCSKVETENEQLKEKMVEVRTEADKIKAEFAGYEDLLNESNHQLEEAHETIESQRRTIQQLEGKVQSKEIMYNSYKSRNGMAILVEGTEHDIYPGEQRDLMVEYLKDKLANLEPYTRQYHLVKSLLEANPEVGNRAALRKGIYDCFRGFTGTTTMGKVFQTKMRDLGFDIIKGKTHDKLIFHNDDRYSISIPVTPKTGTHDNLNQAGDTVRIIL